MVFMGDNFLKSECKFDSDTIPLNQFCGSRLARRKLNDGRIYSDDLTILIRGKFEDEQVELDRSFAVPS